MMNPYELADVRFDDVGPTRVLHFHDPRVGLRAAVVVDTIRAAPSGGGVRMAADLTLGEIARLARAMTYKYALLDLPIGGAKAGIWLDPASPDRPAVVAAFLDAIKPLVATGTFVPGPDMGTAASDFEPLTGKSGVGSGVDEDLTGYGVVAAVRAAAEQMGLSLEESRVAIEGFGKVGAAAARFLAEEGARVVAVSTVRATISAENGLDVAELLELRRTGGDAAIERARGARVLPREALVTIPAEILIPAARPDSLRPEGVPALHARLIVPGANAPYAEGALDALEARGIVAIPDFVANAGGVLAMIAAMQSFDGPRSHELVRERIEHNVRRVLSFAKERGVSPEASAIALARAQLA